MTKAKLLQRETSIVSDLIDKLTPEFLLQLINEAANTLGLPQTPRLHSLIAALSAPQRPDNFARTIAHACATMLASEYERFNRLQATEFLSLVATAELLQNSNQLSQATRHYILTHSTNIKANDLDLFVVFIRHAPAGDRKVCTDAIVPELKARMKRKPSWLILDAICAARPFIDAASYSNEDLTRDLLSLNVDKDFFEKNVTNRRYRLASLLDITPEALVRRLLGRTPQTNMRIDDAIDKLTAQFDQVTARIDPARLQRHIPKSLH